MTTKLLAPLTGSSSPASPAALLSGSRPQPGMATLRSPPLPLSYGSTSAQTLRRGEYRSFTYRLPSHVPELKVSVVCDSGCVCVYASNCSERPNPRNCQWTVLVDSQKSKLGSMVLRTSETHFIGGMYHVGLYAVAESTFTIGCFPTKASASDHLRVASAHMQRPSTHASRSPRDRVSQRIQRKPFVDAGLLENVCAARGLLVGIDNLDDVGEARSRPSTQHSLAGKVVSHSGSAWQASSGPRVSTSPPMPRALRHRS